VLNRRTDKDSLSIVFAGEARRDKGFHLLPAAIRRILASTPRPRVTFNIQAYGAEADEQQASWTDLLVDGAVSVRWGPLSEAEYGSFLEEADLILIPYLRGPYHAQTSGIYCEAAALGIPVVVPSGTWMADQVAKNGGGVLFDAGDPSSLASACLKAIEDYPHLLELARQAAPAWRAFHNAPNFIACLDRLLQDLPTAEAA
jgi:glycosyltransferase involved in cell wall biosynthesis